jgi:hypothetical protein
MVNGRNYALALEGYFLALVVYCLSISLNLGMVFILLLSFYSSQVLFMLGARWEL